MIERINKFLLKNKQDLFFISSISGISLLFLIPLLMPGFIMGHDSQVILSREASRIEAIKDGQFPLRWAGDLNYGYGNPSFIFFYSLGGYLLAFLHFLRIPLETAYELILGSSFIFASLIFYLWTKQLFKKEVAFIGAIFYGLSPYIFLDIYVRAHMGESLSFVFIPAVFYFLEKNFKKITLTNILLAGISYALLIQAHVIMSLMFSFLYVFYIIFRTKFKLKPLILNSSVLILGLVVSAYFWIPSLIEGKYINSNLFVGNWYAGHFLDLKNFLYFAWGFGSSVGEKGGLAPQIGPLHGLIVLSSLFLLKTKLRKNVFFWIIAFIVGLFMSTNLSILLWSNFHALQKVQFPWRFMALSSFSAAVLIAYFFSIYENRYFKLAILVILMLISIPMAKVWKNQSNGDSYYFNYSGTATFHNEATTIWVEGDAYEFPKKRIGIISGLGDVKNETRKSNLHMFLINAKTDLKILDNTVYFPGWRAEVDGKKVPIEFQDQNHRGLITFDVPKGKHNIEVKFGESKVRLLSDIISLVTVIGLFLILISRKWVKRYLKI